MNIQVCPKSAVSGLLLGILLTASSWYGVSLSDRREVRQALLAQAKCDPTGFVAITFSDESQFTCAPTQTQPPTSREEAERRARNRK